MTQKFPFYKQLDEMDCGASCLRMIARFHGRYYSLEYLRELTFVDRQGVSLMAISDAAENIGYHTLGVKISFNQLVEEIPTPCIAFWRQSHFVVVFKATEKFVWIGDPAAGVFKITKQEFLDGWISDTYNEKPVGVLLLMETTPDFYKREGEKESKSGFKYVFSYFKKYKNLLFQLGLGLFFGSILQVIFPFLLRSVVDIGISTSNMNFIFMILVAYTVLFLGQTFVEAIRGWILLHIGIRVNVSLISDFLIKVMKLPIRFFDTRMTADIIQRIYDHQRVEYFLTSDSLLTFFSIFNFFLFSFVLLYFDVTIFILFVAFTFLYFLWIFFFLKKRKELDYKRFDQLSANQSSLIQIVTGMEDIKLFNAEKQKRWAWERIQARLYRVSADYLSMDQWQRSGAAFLNESKNIVIIFVAAKAVIDGSMTLGMLVAIQYIIGQLNSPVDQIGTFIKAAQNAKISLERMNEIHEKEDEEENKDIVTILPDNGDLVLENASFQYGGQHSNLVLKNINLVFPKGKVTAIVGASGSGKTTLLKMLLNFYQPVEGAVRLGDINLSNIQNKVWRNRCSAVLQDGYIFSESIARNIALGDDVIDKKRLLHSVKLANIQSFVESMPLGYNTRIGMEGIGLSQGQKQRILIARAIYKDPEYFFLDEATNSLDAKNEAEIMRNMNEFFIGKTVIIVAHRLSTVKDADNIVVLDNGEIIEQGTHEELVDLNGTYFNLVKNQLELGS
jgi:ATP-binding cassette, subfamily B, bacterial